MDPLDRARNSRTSYHDDDDALTLAEEEHEDDGFLWSLLTEDGSRIAPGD